MVFEEAHELPPDPTVKIIFTGLLILQPLPDKTCQTFVHNVSRDHDLLVEVRRKRPGNPDVIMMRAPGPLRFTGGHTPPAHGLLISKVGVPAAQKGVKAYTGRPTDEGQSLSESLNLSTLLDVSPGSVDTVGGRPSVLIDDGIFYTAQVLPVHFKLNKRDGTKTIEFHEMGTIIGANIYLTAPEQTVNLRWRRPGGDVTLDLEVKPQTTYEIYINNEPLFEDDSATGPAHDEFVEYFKILPEVETGEQFTMEFLPPLPDRGSSRTPCASVLLND